MEEQVTININEQPIEVTINITDAQNGNDGENGLSAYQIALQNGFVGTEVEWLASLQGPPGEAGSGGVPNLPENMIAVGDENNKFFYSPGLNLTPNPFTANLN